MPINVNGVYHPKIMVTFFRNNLIHIINLKKIKEVEFTLKKFMIKIVMGNDFQWIGGKNIISGNICQKSDWKDNYEGNITKTIGINDNDGQK